jgi:hypothetical protein
MKADTSMNRHRTWPALLTLHRLPSAAPKL